MTIEETYRRGLELLDQGQAAAAVEAFARVVELDPGHANAWFQKGLAHDALESLESALADYERALQIDPRCVDAIVNRGFIHDRRGRPEAAIHDYDLALSMAPAHALVGEPDKALADHRRSIELAPRDPVTHRNLGALLLSLDRFAEAIEALDAGLTQAPEGALALLYRGKARAKAQDSGGAEKDLTRVVNLEPAWPEAYFQRASARAQLGKVDDAIADCRKVLELAPTEPMADGAARILAILEKARSRGRTPAAPVASAWSRVLAWVRSLFRGSRP